MGAWVYPRLDPALSSSAVGCGRQFHSCVPESPVGIRRLSRGLPEVLIPSRPGFPGVSRFWGAWAGLLVCLAARFACGQATPPADWFDPAGGPGTVILSGGGRIPDEVRAGDHGGLGGREGGMDRRWDGALLDATADFRWRPRRRCRQSFSRFFGRRFSFGFLLGSMP